MAVRSRASDGVFSKPSSILAKKNLAILQMIVIVNYIIIPCLRKDHFFKLDQPFTPHPSYELNDLLCINTIQFDIYNVSYFYALSEVNKHTCIHTYIMQCKV